MAIPKLLNVRRNMEFTEKHKQRMCLCSVASVSYTHLDVYKRQVSKRVKSNQNATQSHTTEEIR